MPGYVIQISFSDMGGKSPDDDEVVAKRDRKFCSNLFVNQIFCGPDWVTFLQNKHRGSYCVAL